MLSARVLAIDRRASGARARVRRRASARASATRASTSPRRRTPRARVLAPRVDVRGAPYRDATTNRRAIGSRARDRSRARDVDRDGVDRARGDPIEIEIARSLDVLRFYGSRARAFNEV